MYVHIVMLVLVKKCDIQKLIDAGYVQTSNRYRSVARLPEGKTAIQALIESDPVMGQDLMRRLEQWARSINTWILFQCLEILPDLIILLAVCF